MITNPAAYGEGTWYVLIWPRTGGERQVHKPTWRKVSSNA